MSSSFISVLLLSLLCVNVALAKTKEQIRAEQLESKLGDVETQIKERTHRNCTTDEQLERLEILLGLLRDDIYDLRVDQELMKQDMIERLEAVEDALTGRHPTDQTARLEHIFANQYRDFRPSINFTEANLPKVHTSCEAAFEAGWTKSGVYRVSPEGSTVEMDVYCEQESELFGGGWTVIQRRINGTVDFYRKWDQYKNGFGDLKGEFYLGNDNIHLLTASRDQMLKVELEHYGDGFAYANYAAMWVNNESQKYQLHVSGFSAGDPNPGDSFEYHDEMFFSTKDQDNDRSSSSCAQSRKGGWWYKSCTYSNLNGLYGATGSSSVHWYHWKNSNMPLTRVRMMIKANPNYMLTPTSTDTN